MIQKKHHLLLLRFSDLSDPHIASTLSSPISGQLAEGECLRVTGPNGSGKTTFLKLLAGINLPGNGSIEAHPLFYCGHQTGLKLTWSVRQNLAFRLRVYISIMSELAPPSSSWQAPLGAWPSMYLPGLPRSNAPRNDEKNSGQSNCDGYIPVADELTGSLRHGEEPSPLLSSRGAISDVVIQESLWMATPPMGARHDGKLSSIKLEETLAKFRLTKYLDTPLGNLSRGQQQQIALISGLLSPYKLWILDEPFTHLDQHAQTAWQQLMINHCQQSGAIVYSTHNDQIILKDSLRIDLSC